WRGKPAVWSALDFDLRVAVDTRHRSLRIIAIAVVRDLHHLAIQVDGDPVADIAALFAASGLTVVGQEDVVGLVHADVLLSAGVHDMPLDDVVAFGSTWSGIRMSLAVGVEYHRDAARRARRGGPSPGPGLLRRFFRSQVRPAEYHCRDDD